MRTNIDLADLEAFAAVAREKSFHLAASALSLSPSALSRRVQKLEDLVGVRLLERTTRSVTVTAAGHEFLARALEIQSHLEQVILDLKGQPQQRSTLVTVACIPSASHYFLPPVIEHFTSHYPEARVRILDLNAAEVLESVKTSEADFGIDFVGLLEPGLEFFPLLEDPFVLAVNRAHPLARRDSVTWEDIGGQRCITVWKGSGNRLLIDTALAKANTAVTWHYETRHVTTALALVEAGIGVAALPRSALPQHDHPIVPGVALRSPEISRTLGAVRRRDRRVTTTAQALWDALIHKWPPTRKPRLANRRKAATDFSTGSQV